MGCDIFSRAEKRIGEKWQVISGLHPFSDARSYRVFGFLADVRNWAGVMPISQPRGLPQGVVAPVDEETPDDEWLGEHSFSWLLVSELLAVDYDRVVEDRRTTGVVDGITYGSITAEPGQGRSMTLRAFLAPPYFEDLDALVAAGADRIVFGFGD